MAKTYNIGKTKITLVWKYRFSKNKTPLERISEWRGWKISLWFRRNKIVGRNNFGDPRDWNNNLVNDYMLGFTLLIFKGWINWSRGGMIIKIDE